MGMLLIEIIEHATGFSCSRMANEFGLKGEGSVTRYLSKRKAEKISLRDLVALYNIARERLGWSLEFFWQQIEKEALVKPQKRGGQ